MYIIHIPVQGAQEKTVHSDRYGSNCEILCFGYVYIRDLYVHVYINV